MMTMLSNRKREMASETISLALIITLAVVGGITYYGFIWPFGLLKGLFRREAVGKKACRAYLEHAICIHRTKFDTDVLSLLDYLTGNDIVLRKYPTLNPLRKVYVLETYTGGLRYAKFQTLTT